MRFMRIVCFFQGFYYAVTGVWPILQIQSFMAVTGPKEDLWLVKTVGALALAIGIVLITASVRHKPILEAKVLGLTAALAFLAIDIFYVFTGQLSWVYLLDAVPETFFAAFWAFFLIKSPREPQLVS